MSTLISNTQAARDSAFVGSIGVNANMLMPGGGAGAQALSQVGNAMSYLGVGRIRTGVPFTWNVSNYEALAQRGVRFNLTANGNGQVNFYADLAQIDTLARAVHGSVATVEGPNEINVFPITFNGVSSADPRNLWIGDSAQQQLYSLVHSDPNLVGTGVLDLTVGGAVASEYATLGNMSAYADGGNVHVFFGNGDPPAANIAYSLANARLLVHDKPTTITELGYYTAYQSTNWGGVNQDVQAKWTLTGLLDAYKAGVATTYLYELMDGTAHPSTTDREGSFGIFTADGTPKEAAVAVHNMTAILGDTGGNATSFQTGTLSYSLAGMPTTGNTLLMEKSSGVYDIAVWTEPKIWNEASQSETWAPAGTVTLNLGSVASRVIAYDPMTGTAPVGTYTNTGTVTFTLTDHPLIFEVTTGGTTGGGNPPASTSTPTLVVGAGGDDLVLTVAEQAWTGDAQFIVSVDGRQIGGVLTATAAAATGSTEAIHILGNFGGGGHTVGVNFVNDAYGGNPAADRNLFVTGATIDGAAVANSSLALMGQGTQTLGFQLPPDTFDLHISEDTYLGDAQYTIGIDGRQIGGVRTAYAAHGAGQSQDVQLTGNWGSGPHAVQVTFLNDAAGTQPWQDRNLYVDRASYDGSALAGAPAVQKTNGTATLTTQDGAGRALLTLHMAEDAYGGDAQFSVAVDGQAFGGIQSVSALNSLGGSQAFGFAAALAAGTHDVAVTFVNDAYASPTQDRNLYLKGIDVGATAQSGAAAELASNGTMHFAIVVPTH